jgi:site-specific recombinase XerC
VAASQRVKTGSTNKRGTGDQAVAAAVKQCLRELDRPPLAPRTKVAYGQHISAYGVWLAGRRDGGKAIADPKARDYAARDFKRHLKVNRRWKPASVNLALAAVDHFNRFLELGPANVKREPLVQAAPRALAVEQQRELVRAAEASRARDRAIVTLLLYTALRLNELVSLDVDDVSISARKGLLVIRSGKGDLYREVPLNPSCRQALTDWLRERAAADGERALFTGHRAPGPTAVGPSSRSGRAQRRGASGTEALRAHAPAHLRDEPRPLRQRPRLGSGTRRPPTARNDPTLQPALGSRPAGRDGRA